MSKNAIIITPDSKMFIHPLPDDYKAVLDELHAISGTPFVYISEAPYLGSPYCITRPAFADDQKILPKLIYNPVASRLCFSNLENGEDVYGNAAIVWLDDREGCQTMAGLTKEEANIICTTLDLDFFDLTWECDKEFDILSNPGFDGYYEVDEDRYKGDCYGDDVLEEAGYDIEDYDDYEEYDDYDEPQSEGEKSND